MYIVLDHDLEPEGRMIKGGDQQQHQQDRRQRLADPGLHGVVIGADQADHGDHEPQRQRHQGQRADPLHQPVLDALFGRAEADRPAERRTHP